MDRIYSLQVLRALAAIAVVIHHCVWTLAEHHYGIAVGAAGVDVFFVISGIVMVISTREGTTAFHFLWRRFVRVVPMYWLATAAVVVYLYTYHHQTPSTAHVVASFLFLPPPGNLVYPLLYPGWSLNYEVFFYLLLAGSLLVSKKGFPFIAVITAALAAVGPRSGYAFVDYYLNPHMFEFSAGLLVGLALLRGIRVGPALGRTLVLVGIGVFAINSAQPTGNVALLWGLPSVAVVAGLLAFEHVGFVRSRFLQYLGASSYSIYLVHPLVLWGVSAIIGSYRGALLAWGTVAFSVALGVAVYRYVEAPLLRWMTAKEPGGQKKPMRQAG